MAPKKAVKRPKEGEGENSSAEKKVKVSHRSYGQETGMVLVIGQGDVGQLGLGEDVLERRRPALVTLPESIVQAVAGGMHTVCLSDTGSHTVHHDVTSAFDPSVKEQWAANKGSARGAVLGDVTLLMSTSMIYTFGCNDEGALGRDTSEEGSEMSPGKVALEDRVVLVSAGDSHTAALTEDGTVFVWGSFRDNNGVIGLIEPMQKCPLPVKLHLDAPVVKIASGSDHLVMLTQNGEIYTSGCGDQGQLGRVPERFANRGGRKGLMRLLEPQMVVLRPRGIHFSDVFCGAYFTFAVTNDRHVYGFGLSNYYQLGTLSTNTSFLPEKLTAFPNNTAWVGFSGGQHHTVCLNAEGQVYSLGRAEYGRLGLGPDALETRQATIVPGIVEASMVACGASVSFAVTRRGIAYAWGMGTNLQLGTGEEEDEWTPVEITGKQLEKRVVLAASSGGQHTVLLVKDKQES